MILHLSLVLDIEIWALFKKMLPHKKSTFLFEYYPPTRNSISSDKFFIMSKEFDKTFQIEDITALISEMTLIFSSDLLNGQK